MNVRVALAGILIALCFCGSAVIGAETSSTASRRLIERLYEEVYNEHALAKVDKFFAPEFLHHDQAGGVHARDAVSQAFAPMFVAFPDWRGTIDHMIVEGDRVSIFVTWRGTHTGPFHGYAATGRSVEVRSADLYRIHNGLIVEHWDVTSPSELQRQIGLPAGPG